MNKLQQFVQEKCVLAAHPERKTLEEAWEKEQSTKGCLFVENVILNKRVMVLGLPCTLARVLNALTPDYSYEIRHEYNNGYAFLVIRSMKEKDLRDQAIFNLKLLNPDGTDSLFEDQSEETQLAIARLLGWEEEGV